MRVLTDIKRMGGNADVETPTIWTAFGFAALVLLIVLGAMLMGCQSPAGAAAATMTAPISIGQDSFAQRIAAFQRRAAQ